MEPESPDSEDRRAEGESDSPEDQTAEMIKLEQMHQIIELPSDRLIGAEMDPDLFLKSNRASLFI